MEGSTLSPPTMSSLICRRPSPSHPLHLSPQHPLLPQCRLLGRSNASVVFVSLPSPKLLTHRLLPKHHSLPPDKPDSELDSAPQSTEFNKEIGGQGSAASRPSTVAFILAVLKSWLRGLPFWTQKKPPELNKHSPESFVVRVDQGRLTLDNKAAKYIQLIIVNALLECLQVEKLGRSFSLTNPIDLHIKMELKQQASRNEDKPFMNPGMPEKQIDPTKPSRSTWSTQELHSTIVSTVAFVLVRMMTAVSIDSIVGALHPPIKLDKKITTKKKVLTFKDVKGCDDAKQELGEVVEYLKNPAKFTRLGRKLSKGILLIGAPGTGKTLIAKAIAGEAGVPILYKAGFEFEEMFVRVGAWYVRSLFEDAKKKAPCILFIDEIDAVRSTRKQSEGHTNRALHQLLVELDSFLQNEGIILMAATNLPDILDRALMSPGRFDQHIFVPHPDVRGRREILELYLQDKPLADDVDSKAIARGTPGFSGADLANLVNIAAIKAAVEDVEKLDAAQLESAKNRIIQDTERKTMFISEELKKLKAYHESGHVIVALNTDDAHPIHKVTIFPWGSALGIATQLPSGDKTSISKKQLLARLDVCMGGQVAEELIFGEDCVTVGASTDFHTATELAQYMVTTCGMCDAVSPVSVKERPSSEMQSQVEAEVVKLLREACERVKRLLKKHEKALHALAMVLFEHETLSAEDIKRVVDPYSKA